MADKKWCVFRNDFGGISVEFNRPELGPEEFDTEAEAVDYAINCVIGWQEPLRSSMRTLRARQRKLRARR